MNLTYLIGNGADINLGMKSQYNQFYKYLKENKTKLLEENILFKLIEKDEKCWSYFEKMIGAITCYSLDKSEMSENLNLLDFEFTSEEMERVINNFSDEDIFRNFDENKLLDYVDGFRNEFESYLINEEKRVVGELRANDNKESILESLVYFWLKNPFNSIDDDWTSNPNEVFFRELSDDIEKMFSRIHDSSEKIIEINYHILNFNYTSVMNVFFETELELKELLQDEWKGILRKRFPQYTNLLVRVNFSHHHIHEDIENGMFLGVDNVNQLNQKFISDDFIIRTLVKPDRIKMLDEMDDSLTNKFENFRDLISRSHYIFIFGMSFGETDKTWWQWILNKLHIEGSLPRRVSMYDFEITPMIRKSMRYGRLYQESQHFLIKYFETEDSDSVSKLEKNVRVVGRSEKLFSKLDNNDAED